MIADGLQVMRVERQKPSVLPLICGMRQTSQPVLGGFSTGSQDVCSVPVGGCCLNKCVQADGGRCQGIGAGSKVVCTEYSIVNYE